MDTLWKPFGVVKLPRSSWQTGWMLLGSYFSTTLFCKRDDIPGSRARTRAAWGQVNQNLVNKIQGSTKHLLLSCQLKVGDKGYRSATTRKAKFKTQLVLAKYQAQPLPIQQEACPCALPDSVDFTVQFISNLQSRFVEAGKNNRLTISSPKPLKTSVNPTKTLYKNLENSSRNFWQLW